MKRINLVLSVLLLLALVACGTPETGGREPVYIGQAEIVAQLSAPPMVSLHIMGDLPTACHDFHAEVEAPDSDNRIDVTVYSTVNPTMRCAQVLQPFDESVEIPMDGQSEGIYSIYLNDSPVGEFNYVVQ
jgi:hypothetical protein